MKKHHVLLSPPVGEAGRDSSREPSLHATEQPAGRPWQPAKIRRRFADIRPSDTSAMALERVSRGRARLNLAAARIRGCGSAGEAVSDIVSVSEEMVVTSRG